MFVDYLEVRVRDTGWNTYPCDWLGHSSYRCGKCRKDYFRVQSTSEHAEECPKCKAKVEVTRRSD